MSLISRKNQVTIPVDALREAALEQGDNDAAQSGEDDVRIESFDRRVARQWAALRAAD
jgi:hypothetical protein